MSAIATRSRLESFSEERGGWLWDAIEEGLGTYLYGFLGDTMRTNPRIYGIRMKEYPNTIGLCTNIHRKGVEGQGTKSQDERRQGGTDRSHIGAGRPHHGPTSGALLRGAFRLFLFSDMFSDNFFTGINSA